MKRITILVAALAVMATTPMARAMEAGEYKAHHGRIQAEYLASKARCKPLQGNARDLCQVRALGTRHVARAELDTQFRPGPKSEEKLSMARAESTYSLAKEQCDDLKGNAKDVCRKDAKAGLAAAKADAKAVRSAMKH